MNGRQHGIKLMVEELTKMATAEFKAGETMTREDMLAMIQRAEARCNNSATQRRTRQ